jgi:hypothetical protein
VTAKEMILKHCEKSADHHSAIARTEQKIAKAHGDIAESHTNAVLAQGHRDLADQHGAGAQHHQARAKHFLEMHEGLSGIAPEVFDSHDDAGDELRSLRAADFVKTFVGEI